MADVLSQRSERKAVVERLVQAALRAVDPGQATRRAMQRRQTTLRVAGIDYDLRQFRRVLVIGAGKAAGPMAQAAEEILAYFLTAGIVVVRRGYAVPTSKIAILEAGHPIPDQASVSAAEHIARLVDHSSADDLIICLLSGGASAVLALPAEGISLADKAAVTNSLLRAGATINELNAVRKHLSRLKGGGLARLVAPATLISLILSDVVGDPLDVIASGPTVPDPSTYADAYAVLAKYRLLDAVPEAILHRFRDGIAGKVPETPKLGDPVFSGIRSVIVGSNELAAQAAIDAAHEHQMHASLLSTFIEGEARECGRVFAAIAKEMVHSGHPLARPACLVAGGETTVTVLGHGRGGRNQEFALAAGIQLAGWEGVAVASVATDGTDGPTSAAGGYADGETVALARAQGLDPFRALADNDSHRLLAALDDLIVTGPTNTNVNDLMFLLAF